MVNQKLRKKKKDLNPISRSLVNIGMGIRKGVEKIKENQRYKNSPEYHKKVLADIKLKNKILEQQEKADKMRFNMAMNKEKFKEKKAKNKQKNFDPFGSGDYPF